MTPTRPMDILDVLERHALQYPENKAFTFLSDKAPGETDPIDLSFKQLHTRVRQLAQTLQVQSKTGDRVLLVFPSGLDYIYSFFACLYAGMIAVPVYPPDPSQPDRDLSRLKKITDNARPTLGLTTALLLNQVKSGFDGLADKDRMQWIPVDAQDLPQAETSIRSHPFSSTAPAFIQYTSGSTGSPKGVVVSHGNIIEHLGMLQQQYDISSHDPFVSWLPFYHDMGLVGNIIFPAFTGSRCIFMSPQSFLKNPLRWLSTLSRYRGVISAAPNFAYDLCVRHVEKVGKAACRDLDLSSWDVAVNGSEPVRAETLERFYHTFSPYGFKQKAFCPSYGMAEVTLLIAASGRGKSSCFLRFDSEALASNQVAVTADAETKEVVTLVGCGTPCENQTVVIADPRSGTLMPESTIGEIRVAGKNVTERYWNLPDQTRNTFAVPIDSKSDQRFLHTGDLGFFKEGQLFITGRIKDMILIRGKNHAPQDIEESVGKSHSQIRPGCCVAFSVEYDGEEKLVVVGEIRKTDLNDAECRDIVRCIRNAAARNHGLWAHAVALIPPRTIPKTSSGKLQRGACRSAFIQGRFDFVFEFTQGTADGDSSQSAILIQLRQTPNPNTRMVLSGLYLQEQAALLLDLPPAQVSMDDPLYLLGFDSLLFFEFKNVVETGLGIALCMNDRFMEMSIAGIAASLFAMEIEEDF